MNRVDLLRAPDWEGLFLNGNLIDEGNRLNEGYDRYIYFKEVEERFEVDRVHMKFVPKAYHEYLAENGYFHTSIDDVLNYKGKIIDTI